MKKDYRIAGIIAVVLIVIDQITKWIVVAQIPYLGAATEKHTIIPNFIYLTNHRNSGAAWGLFQGQLIFFTIITFIALGVFIAMSKDLDFKKRFVFSLGLTLLLAGAIGNFIDRLRLGYVIDFIDTYIFGYNFPIFNVADMCLTVGIIAFSIDMLIIEPRGQKKDENTNL